MTFETKEEIARRHTDDGFHKLDGYDHYNTCLCGWCGASREATARKMFEKRGVWKPQASQVERGAYWLFRMEMHGKAIDTDDADWQMARSLMNCLLDSAVIAQQSVSAPAEREQQSVALSRTDWYGTKGETDMDMNVTMTTVAAGAVELTEAQARQSLTQLGVAHDGKKLVSKVRLTGYDMNNHLTTEVIAKLPLIVDPTKWLKVILAIDEESEDELPWLADAMTKMLVRWREANGKPSPEELADQAKRMAAAKITGESAVRRARLAAKHAEIEAKAKAEPTTPWSRALSFNDAADAPPPPFGLIRSISGRSADTVIIDDPHARGVALNSTVHPWMDWHMSRAFKLPANVGGERPRHILRSRVLRAQERTIAFDQDPCWGDDPILEDRTWSSHG